ncbi:MAG: hypothetical protein PVG53_01885 [Holophagae bacterium]
MPDGPEFRRAADRVAAPIEGRVADDVSFAFDRLKRYERELANQVVDEITTRRKAMLTRFANGLTVYNHNQLDGRDGQPRRVCGAVVEQAAVGVRKVFRCPECQPTGTAR